MNCIPVPALKDIGLTNLALLLYNDEEIKQLSEPGIIDCLELDQLINEKLSKLCLPNEVCDDLGVIMKRGYLLLTKFYALHQYLELFLCEQCECLQEISQSCHFWKFWTTGTSFNEQKIAECLIRDQSLSDAIRFILICEYFMEADYRSEWQQMLLIVKSSLLKENVAEIKETVKSIMPQEFVGLRRKFQKLMNDVIGIID